MDDTNDNKPSDNVPLTSTSASPSSNTDNLGLIADQTATIAVVHASVGSGHKVAAEAIAEALEHIVEACKERFAPVSTKINVEVLDILSFGRIVFDGDKAASMFTGPTRPIYDITWRYVLTGRLLWGGGTIWSHLMFSDFTQWVREKNPAAVICTHITAANVAVGARMITRQEFPIVSVPTDYDIEGLWPHKYTDLFCVGTESMAETLRARNIEEERIIITGIPARSDFRTGYDRDEVRREWNIPQDKKLALVLAGASLPRPYVRFRETLAKALPYFKDLEHIHLIIIAGKDSDYASGLRRHLEREGVQNVTVLGYTNQIAKLMAASDFAICKPGGLTVTECLCTQTPMILVGKAYGQEKVNVRMLTSLGAALHVQTARELVTAMKFVSRIGSSLEAMLANAEQLSRPDAAVQIAMSSLQLAIAPTTGGDRERRLSKRPFLSFYWGQQPAHTR
ncbi:MAG: UDP-N-acetylglucosamine--LPS N-acetylglucosamine transferase [Coriobacteriaceae bacterium]|nr:UDP-N-acetylglucosamine--LPS N-acetylglucosamine transferase [Coriobacteriaceae bacterium]